LKIRILHVIDTLARAGTQKQMALLAENLPRDEFAVHVCALSCGGPWGVELARAGIEVTEIGRRGVLDPFAWRRLCQHVSRLRPDVIHAWRSPANAVGWAAARRCGVRRVIVSHRSADHGKLPAELAVDRMIARRADAVAVNSRAVRDFCVQHGLPAAKIRVIAGGVAPAAASPATRGQVLAELGLGPRSRLIGLVGPLLESKGGKDAVWACDLLKEHGGHDAHLLVFGDGPYRQRLTRFRDQVRIGDKVHFLGDRGDLAQWLPHFDLLWSTSRREGLAGAILEAMAAGVPVVASDIPANRELIADGATGFLVPVGQRAGFARGAQRLLNDPALAQRLGQAARDRVEREFAVAPMVRAYAALYRELVA
jgi:glycosyltransferase involved in cell wall biosynthesis